MIVRLSPFIREFSAIEGRIYNVHGITTIAAGGGESSFLLPFSSPLQPSTNIDALTSFSCVINIPVHLIESLVDPHSLSRPRHGRETLSTSTHQIHALFNNRLHRNPGSLYSFLRHSSIMGQHSCLHPRFTLPLRHPLFQLASVDG